MIIAPGQAAVPPPCEEGATQPQAAEPEYTIADSVVTYLRQIHEQYEKELFKAALVFAEVEYKDMPADVKVCITAPHMHKARKLLEVEASRLANRKDEEEKRKTRRMLLVGMVAYAFATLSGLFSRFIVSPGAAPQNWSIPFIIFAAIGYAGGFGCLCYNYYSFKKGEKSKCK